MVGRVRARLREVEALNLEVLWYAAAFVAVYALQAALWQIDLSYQMHFAPACSANDTVRLSCTYTASATVYAITPETISIRGDGFVTNNAELPLGADTSFLHAGDTVTAVEWHGHIVSLTRGGRTLSAVGSPDAGPIAWPGVLVFSATFGVLAFIVKKLMKRTRMTVDPSKSFWGRS